MSASGDLTPRIASAYDRLAQIDSVLDAKALADEAMALEVLAQNIGESVAITNEIVEVRLRAERRGGELIPLHYPTGGDRKSKSRTATLILPISRSRSQRWQQVARLPEDKFEQTIADIKAGEDELSRGELLLRGYKLIIPDPVDTPDIVPAAYRCIVVDPPWPMQKINRRERPLQGETLDYSVMTLDEIAELDVAAMADEDAHLYLWTTHRFLPDALRIAKGWGFTYECLMTWRKNVGITPFSWMYDTEHVLFCRRGSLPVQTKGQRLSFDAKVVGHSIKPDVFYERAVAASPGPRLEMFARRDRDGFDRWSHSAVTVDA